MEKVSKPKEMSDLKDIWHHLVLELHNALFGVSIFL